MLLVLLARVLVLSNMRVMKKIPFGEKPMRAESNIAQFLIVKMAILMISMPMEFLS